MVLVWLLAALLVLPNRAAFGQVGPTTDAPDPFLPAGTSGACNSVAVDQPLVIVLVDFPDGRLPDGSPPLQDSDLSLVKNIDAVGSMGYVRDGSGEFRSKARKYAYEDYWDAVFAPLFSTEPYVGSRHPDFSTHEGYIPPVTADPTQEMYRLEVYGSVRDYWEETSYGNLLIRPFQTRGYGRIADKYNSGIVNRVIRMGGRNYVQWICLPLDKPAYSLESGPERDPVHATVERLRLLHQDPSNPEYLEFDIDAYNGKLAIIASGGRLGGWASMNAREFIVPEKLEYLQNNSPAVIFNAIGELAHEFGHAIGISHQAVGPYDLMHVGGLGLRRYYFCPPHVNPRLKLEMGWLKSTDIVKISSGQTISIPPVTHNAKKVVLITLYGDAGRGGDYGHSEYFLVEYRKREKFNRFSGGPDATFLGGGLVWHYARFGRFSFKEGGEVPRNFALKAQDSGGTLRGNRGSPSHFYYSGHSILDSATNPCTCSIDGYPTGISLYGFRESEEALRFSVSYARGAVPVWDRFYRACDPIEFPLSGTVYVEGARAFNQISFAEGSLVSLSPGGGIHANHCSVSRATLQLNAASYLRIRSTLAVLGSFTVRGTGTILFGSASQVVIGGFTRLTAEPGVTLEIRPGVTFRSGPGGLIHARGKVLAKGIAQQRIRFTSLGETWNGLVLSGRGADHSILEYVEVDKVQTCGGAAVTVVGAQEVSIRNCSITCNVDRGTHGLFLWNAGWPEIFDNSISANGGYGIGLAASCGYLYHNTISVNAGGGVYCTRWALPSFGKPGFDARGGNNTVTGGNVGVEASHSSYPCIGLSGSESYGYNNMAGVTGLRVSAMDGCDVTAEMNFWGRNPQASWFVARSGSTISWTPYLESEEGGVAGESGHEVVPARDSSGGDFAKAARCRILGDYIQAKSILSRAIHGGGASREYSRGAVELMALYSATRDPELLQLCRSALACRNNDDPFFALGEAKILQLGGRTAEARDRLRELIVHFPGTECARAASLDLCFSLLCEPGTNENVAPTRSSLRGVEVDDENVRMAFWLLSQLCGQEGPVRHERMSVEREGPQVTPGIVLEAYPNPFNPITTIRYRIAARAHVTVSVYNALGQSVATLVEREEEAGGHAVRFEAPGLSSGVYYCRLRAGEVAQTTRLLLIR